VTHRRRPRPQQEFDHAWLQLSRPLAANAVNRPRDGIRDIPLLPASGHGIVRLAHHPGGRPVISWQVLVVADRHAQRFFGDFVFGVAVRN